jgi:hypothetical protein
VARRIYTRSALVKKEEPSAVVSGRARSVEHKDIINYLNRTGSAKL